MIDRFLRCAALTVAALVLAGCSNEISGQAVASGPPPTSAAPRTAVTTASATTAPVTADPTAAPGSGNTDPNLDAAAAKLRPFLLVPDDIGPGFTAGDQPLPDPAAPAICGGPGVVARFPYAVRIGAGINGPTAGVFVQETVSVYGDDAIAQAAYQANQDGLACSEGSVSGSPVVLAPAEDLSADVPGDQSTGWQIGGDGFDLVLITVRSGELVVNFAFVAPEGASADLPDPLAISRAGVAKLGG